jgi:oligogalacturonide transport system permease protein
MTSDIDFPVQAAGRTAPIALERKLRRKARIAALIRYALLVAVGLVMIYPLIWLVGASFKTNAEMFSSPGFWPSEPTLSGYIEGWQTSTPYTFGRFFWNTFLIIVPKVIGTAISCTLVAYGFARFEFPGKNILFATVIATLLLPNVVTRIPQYLLSAGSTASCRSGCPRRSPATPSSSS